MLLGALAVVLVALGVGALLVSRGCGSGRARDREEASEELGDDEDFYEFSGRASGEPAGRVTGRVIPDGPLPRLPEHFRARVVLDALGTQVPSLTPEQLVATVQQNRGPMRECVRSAGGLRALRNGGGPPGTGGVADGGVRARPRMRFDIAPNGRVVPGSFSLDPAGPGGLADCVAEVLSGTTFPPTGGDGAHVEMPLGLGRGGGRRRPDGGTESGERRTRGGAGGGADRASGNATVPAIAPP